MNAGRLVAIAVVLGFSSCAHVPRIVMGHKPPPVRVQHHLVAAMVPTTRAHSAKLEVTKERAEAVILVTLDGTRWQEVFGGTDPTLAKEAHVPSMTAAKLMPTLTRWRTSEGTSLGAPGFGEMRASGPNYVSLPGYTEIMSGRAPSRCQSNFCDAAPEPALADEVLSEYPDDHVAVVSSWESIARVAGSNQGLHLSTGRYLSRGVPPSWLAPGFKVGPWPGEGSYRPDFMTAKLALRVLERDRPRFMFVGLGDTDEHAHHGDYASYIDALRSADAFLSALEKTVDGMGERGKETAILVTCDHGRSAGFRDHGGAWPESGRVWLVAKGRGIAALGATDSEGARLADIAPTVRELLNVPSDEDERAGRRLDELLDGPPSATAWTEPGD